MLEGKEDEKVERLEDVWQSSRQSVGALPIICIFV